MARRIDIELTSRRQDGSWTWRAPGARQPRGDVGGELIPSDAKVGDVLRADAEFELEGIVVTAVQAPKADPARGDVGGRIEILGSGRAESGGVSVSLVPGGRRPGRDDPDGRERRGRRPADAGDRRPGRGRPGPRAGAGTGTGADDAKGESGERRPRRAPADRERRGEPGEGGRGAGRPRTERSADGSPARPGRPGRPRRLEPASTFRNAALADLRPEQLPVAEQLLRGGIPALRTAIDEQNARARAEGRPPVSPDPLLAMAEELLPKMNLATWKDRATAMRTAGRDAPLREVRSVVAGASTVALDEDGRALLTTLRESLDARVVALRDAWLGRITGALGEDRVEEALRVASRPPEPAARVPAELAVRLATAAGSAMASDVPEDRWTALLDAVVSSPVRRSVKPAGLPAEPSDQLLTAARRAAGQVPELARLLGLPIPPPPGPRRPTTVGSRRN